MTPLDHYIAADNEIYEIRESIQKSLLSMLSCNMQIALIGFLEAAVGIAFNLPRFFLLTAVCIIYSAYQICKDFETFEQYTNL